MERLSSLAGLCLPPTEGQLPWAEAETPEWVVDAAEREQILRESERLGVFPAVWRRLHELGPGADLAANPRWARRSRSILAQNLALEHSQKKLLSALNRKGLRCRVVKGVPLARRLYGDIGRRESSDIDLICPPEEVAAVYERLKSLGLRDLKEAWTEAGLGRALKQPGFLFPEIKLSAPGGILVELHWDWTGEEFPLGDPLDDAEAYAVYLCRHAAKHFWCSLQWTADIELLFRQAREGFDWPRFWRLARRADAERDCAASLLICETVFHGGFGCGQKPVRSRPARRLAAQALAALGTAQGRDRTRRHPAMRLLQTDGWKRRVRRFGSWLRPAPQCFNDSTMAGKSVPIVWAERYFRLALRAVARLVPAPRWNTRLYKAAELSLRDWAAIGRASAVLLLANAGLRLLPFRWMARWASPAGTAPGTPTAESRERVRFLTRAVEIAASHHLMQMSCLPKALALQRLLGRRGVAADLKIGMREVGGAIQGHAWIEWNGEAIYEQAGAAGLYKVLSLETSRAPKSY